MEIDVHSVQNESFPLDSKCQKMKGSLGRSGPQQKRKTASRFSGRFTLSKIFSDTFRSYLAKNKKDENKESKKKKIAPGVETGTNYFGPDELLINEKKVASKENYSLFNGLDHQEHKCAPHQMVMHEKKKMTRPSLILESNFDPTEKLLSPGANSYSQSEIEQRSLRKTNNLSMISSLNGTPILESAELSHCNLINKTLLGDQTEKDRISKKIQKSCKKMKAPNPFYQTDQQDSKQIINLGMNDNITVSVGMNVLLPYEKTDSIFSTNFVNNQFKSTDISKISRMITTTSKNFNKVMKTHSFPSLRHANEKEKVNKNSNLVRFSSLPVLFCQASSKASDNTCMTKSEVDLSANGVEIHKSVIHVKNETLHPKINEISKLTVESCVYPNEIVEKATHSGINSSVAYNNDILEVRNREFYNLGKKSTKTIITVGSANNVGLSISDKTKIETEKKTTSDNANATSLGLNEDIRNSKEFEKVEEKEMKKHFECVQESTDFETCQEPSDRHPFNEYSYMRRQRNNMDLIVPPPDEKSKNAIRLETNSNESLQNFAESNLCSANNQLCSVSSGYLFINVLMNDEEQSKNQTQLNSLPAVQESNEMSFDAKRYLIDEKSNVIRSFENRENQSCQQDESSSLNKSDEMCATKSASEQMIRCNDSDKLEKKVKILESESNESPDKKRLQLKKCNSDDRNQIHSNEDEQYKSHSFKMKQISEFICNQESKHFICNRNNSFSKCTSSLFRSYSCDDIYSDSKGIVPIFISPFHYYQNPQDETKDIIRNNSQSIFYNNPSDSNVTSPDLTTYRKKKKYRSRQDDSLWLKHSDDLSTTDWEIHRGPDSTSGISSEESISEEERFFKRILESSQVPSNYQMEEDQYNVIRAMIIKKGNNRLNSKNDESATNQEMNKKSLHLSCKHQVTRSMKNNKQAEDKPEWVASSVARSKRRSMIDWGTLELKQNLDDSQVNSASRNFTTTDGLSDSVGTVKDISFIFNENPKEIDRNQFHSNEESLCKEKLKKIMKSTSTVPTKPLQNSKIKNTKCSKENNAVKSKIIQKDSKKLSGEGQMLVPNLVSSRLCKAKSATNLCSKSLYASRIPVSTQCANKFPNISWSLKSPNININGSKSSYSCSQEASIKNSSPNRTDSADDQSKFSKFVQSRSASMTNLKASELNLKSVDVQHPPRLLTNSLLSESSILTKNSSLEEQLSVSTRKEIPPIHSMQRRKNAALNKGNCSEVAAFPKKSSIPKSGTSIPTLSSNMKKPLKCPSNKQLGLWKVENGKSTQRSNLIVDNRSQLKEISSHNKNRTNLELSLQLEEKLGTIAV